MRQSYQFDEPAGGNTVLNARETIMSGTPCVYIPGLNIV